MARQKNIATEALKRLGVPIAIASLTAFFCQPIYMAGGKCDYLLMGLLVGIPFGIQKMMLWIVPHGYGIAGTTAMLAFNILIGGLIGIFVFAYRIVTGILSLTTMVFTRLIHKGKEY